MAAVKWLLAGGTGSEAYSAQWRITMVDPSYRHGYGEIAAARLLGPDDRAWLAFVENTLGFPAWMLPAVFRAVNFEAWRRANDPIITVRAHARRLAGRMAWLSPAREGNSVLAVAPDVSKSFLTSAAGPVTEFSALACIL